MREKTTPITKIKANRQNAKKSTGPKNTSLTRLNALKHGLLSKEVLIKGEDKKLLEEFGKNLRLELAPQGELENILIDRIVSSTWRLKRAIKVERDYIQTKYQSSKTIDWSDKEREDSLAWNMVVDRELGDSNAWLNLIRYETAIEKQIYKALHELIRLQGARKGENPPAPLALDIDISHSS